MKLNYKRTILIGLAFLSVSAFWQFYDNEIPKILKYSFGLGETMTGVIMALDNILALFLLPLFGALSDRTESNFGKRMPYIVFGTALSVVFYVLLIVFARPSGNLAFFVTVLLLLLISMGTYRSPAVSLMPDLTPAPLRSAGNAIINLMGALGGVFTLAMTMVLLKKDDSVPESETNYIPLMLSIVLCMVISIAILFFTIKENAIRKQINEEGGLGSFAEKIDQDKVTAMKGTKLPPEVFRSLAFLLVSVAFWFMAYNAVTTAFSRYVIEVWGQTGGSYAGNLMVATVAAVLSFVPIGIISSKLGRKKVILAGIVLMSLSFLSVFLIPARILMSPFFTLSFGSVALTCKYINIFFVTIGIGWASINVNSYPMVVEMSKSADIGKYTGTYYTFSMAAQVFTPILSGFLLEKVSYNTLFPYAFVFSTLAFFTMLMVKHGDSKPDPKKTVLEHFDVDD